MAPEFSRPDLSRPEFSRPLALGLVGPGGRLETLVATPAECAALARRFGILDVVDCSAALRLTAEPDGAVLVEGVLTATVIQACVVSFEPVTQAVADQVLLRLLPPGREPGDGPEDPDELPTETGVADLGEAMAEQLALALDPYPRAADAALPDAATSGGLGSFAALAALRRPQ